MPSPLAPDQTQVSPLAAQNNSQPQMSLIDQDRQLATKQAFEAGRYYKDASGNMQIIPPNKGDEAYVNMNLTPQEQNLYQMHLQNLYGPGGVTNPDGSRSTLYQITAEFNGKTYVIPRVWNGQILPPEQAIQQAQQYGLNKFPAYSSEQEAQARYQQMHGYMEQDAQAYFRGRGK